MKHQFTLHVGWMSTYTMILIALLCAEMYAVGANRGWALTTNVMAIVERAPWVAWPIVVFLAWLFLHFGFRLIPMAFGRPPLMWL